MGPIKAVARCYIRMLNFTGRARRAEYWWFMLYQTLLGAGVFLGYIYWAVANGRADPAFAAMIAEHGGFGYYTEQMMTRNAGIISLVYLVLFIIPNFSVTVRRLHDTNRSGWNILMPTAVGIVSGVVGGLFLGGSVAAGSAGGMFIAVMAISLPSMIASIVLLVWLCLPGTNGPNRFGDDPIEDRKAAVPSHPALAPRLEGEALDRAETARRAAARDYYKRRVLPSIQKA